MSNNAVSAYEDGEKPLSRWTKENITEAIDYLNPEVSGILKTLSIPDGFVGFVIPSIKEKLSS